MEVFLLLLDEIDDAVGMVRYLWPRLLGLLLAITLLFATGFLFLVFPRLVLPSVAALFSAALLERLRHRHLTEIPGKR